MVDGEVDCDKGRGRNRCYHDMVHQGDLRDRGGRAGAWTLCWPSGRGNGRGEGTGTDRRRLRPKEHSTAGLAFG